MPVKWSDDGFPYMTQGEDLVPLILKRDGVTRGTHTSFGNFEKTDNFDGIVLDHEWMTLRTPATDLYSLTESPGSLVLKCANVAASELKTPAFISRRMQHHKFECSTRMLFNPADDKDAAGLLLFKDETHHYFFSVRQSGNKKKIALEKISGSGFDILADNSLVISERDYISLKVISEGTTYAFYYSVGAGKWQMLCKNVDSRYLSTANAGGFTGTTIGMYATK
jgi:alpha-N-arabinofuranosidase